MGGKIERIGDDISHTNAAILQVGLQAGVANSILIKLNQIGTVSETLHSIKMAQKNNHNYSFSPRSSEREATAIADLPVATAAAHNNTGSACGEKRIAKYHLFL